jgi:tetratricopeptide (TPR) repeat protein
MTALVLCSSYFGLKRAEAISFYASGRHYLASHQLDEGIAQLRRAIAIAPATIDLEDTYVRLVPMLFNRGDAEAVRALTAALERFPRNHTLRLVRLALDSLTAPEAARARHKLDSFKRAAGVSRLVAEIYYNIGRGRQHHGDGPGAVRAFRRSLEFDPQRSQTLQSLTTALATP